MTEKYCLRSDGDGHNYIVPVSRLKEWDEWSEIPSEDERAWDVPNYAHSLGGWPGQIHFENPTIDGKPIF